MKVERETSGPIAVSCQHDPGRDLPPNVSLLDVELRYPQLEGYATTETFELDDDGKVKAELSYHRT